MAVTTAEAIAAVRARLNAGSYGFPLYYNGDDAPILPDTPSPFAFVVFNNEGSIAVSYGGGRGGTVYRNRARVEAYMFSPMGYGAEAVSTYAETIAVRLRSFRNDVISCFSADVIPIGPGSTISVQGLASDVSNYQCAIAECLLFFDQTGGAVVDIVAAWVPANAKIHIDFVGGSPQGRAWSNGAEVAISTLLGSDPNTAGGWGDTSYDPTQLTVDGYVQTLDSIGLIGAARAKVLAGSTIRLYSSTVSSAVSGGMEVGVVSLNGNSAIELNLDNGSGVPANSFKAFSWNGTLDESIASIKNNAIGSRNAMACTLTPTRMDAAVNGSATVSAALTTDDYPVSGADPIIAVFIDSHELALQSITIYDPLPTTAGLSALSAIS